LTTIISGKNGLAAPSFLPLFIQEKASHKDDVLPFTQSTISKHYRKHMQKPQAVAQPLISYTTGLLTEKTLLPLCKFFYDSKDYKNMKRF